MATKVPVDQVFRNQLERVSDFAFNEAVAGVFDDMVSRSVPFYIEIQRMLAELAASAVMAWLKKARSPVLRLNDT